MLPFIRNHSSKIFLLSILFVANCFKPKIYSAEGIHERGNTKISGMWTGIFLTQFNEEISSVGFEMLDDGGTVTGYEYAPMGAEGKLIPLRQILGKYDGGILAIDFLSPSSEKNPNVMSRFIGSIENNELIGNYTLLPFSIKLRDGGVVQFLELTVKAKLSLQL